MAGAWWLVMIKRLRFAGVTGASLAGVYHPPAATDLMASLSSPR